MGILFEALRIKIESIYECMYSGHHTQDGASNLLGAIETTTKPQTTSP